MWKEVDIQNYKSAKACKNAKAESATFYIVCKLSIFIAHEIKDNLFLLLFGACITSLRGEARLTLTQRPVGQISMLANTSFLIPANTCLSGIS